MLNVPKQTLHKCMQYPTIVQQCLYTAYIYYSLKDALENKYLKMIKRLETISESRMKTLYPDFMKDQTSEFYK